MFAVGFVALFRMACAGYTARQKTMPQRAKVKLKCTCILRAYRQKGAMETPDPANTALEFLAEAEGRCPKLRGVRMWMPFLSEQIGYLAVASAAELAKRTDLWPKISARENYLVLCLLDIHLLEVLSEYSEYLNDTSLALAVTEAVHFGITGTRMEEPSWDDLDRGKTRSTRGVFKYLRARKRWPGIDNSDAMLFGSEWGDIVNNAPMDVAEIIGSTPIFKAAQQHARKIIRMLLYGEQPIP